jgi:hypothetical protein
METATLDHSSLDHAKNSTFMDTAFYDAFPGLEYPLPHPSPFGLSAITRSPGFESLSLPAMDYTYTPNAFPPSALPTRPFTPPDSVHPGHLSSLSAGELSSDGMTSGRQSRGSGTHSPPLMHPTALSSVPRSHRFNPLTTRSSTRERKRRSSKSDDFGSDDEDDADYSQAPANSDVRREEIRRQRIESEQRRRDELRDGYRRLKDALPVSNQKSSKVSLLDRATTHIKYLEVTNQQLQQRLAQAEAETHRLRQVNEALMLGAAAERRNTASLVARSSADGSPGSAF